MGDCDYCGTSLSEDGDTEQATGSRHYTATCREYVYTAMRSTKAQLAAKTAECKQLGDDIVGWFQTQAEMQREIDAKTAECDRLRAGLGLDRTWPLLDVLAKLADGVEHLLNAHDCDGHGWEEYGRAAKEARLIIASTAPRDADVPNFTIFNCIACDRSTSGKNDGSFDSPRWRRVDHVDGNNSLCPDCVADLPESLRWVRRDYPNAELRVEKVKPCQTCNDTGWYHAGTHSCPACSPVKP